MQNEKEKFDKVAYNNSFNAEKYDRISLMVKKGERDRIREHAERHGEKLNGFINRAIDETMERDNAKENGEG